MHVFIPVSYKAPLGGLQSHVRDQALALKRERHDVTVMCSAGPFADVLRASDIRVLETSYDNLWTDVERANAVGRYDLVHAHPFRSRLVGLEVARRQDVPFLVTFH